MLKLLVFLSAFSGIYLNRFGLQISSDFSLSFSYIFLYGALAVAFLRFKIFFDAPSCVCMMCLGLSGLVSFILGDTSKTLTSLLLFCFIYFPFCLRPGRYNSNSHILFANLYSALLVPLALLGILQFFIQFLFNPSWLFDFRQLLPSFIQNKNPMNTVIPIGSFIKSNGFVLLEPSIFSQWMSLGIYFSLLLPISFSALTCYYLGLALSFSGTGLLMFFWIFLFSLFSKDRSVLLFNFASVLFLIGFLTLGPGKLTLDRLNEFFGGQQLQTTSAAVRFINPVIATRDSLALSAKCFFVGNGPGTTMRSKVDFDYHDPAYAKLLIEYGMLGTFLFLSFIFISNRGFLRPVPLCFLFFFQFFFCGGHLLTFDIVAVYLMFFKLIPILDA